MYWARLSKICVQKLPFYPEGTRAIAHHTRVSSELAFKFRCTSAYSARWRSLMFPCTQYSGAFYAELRFLSWLCISPVNLEVVEKQLLRNLIALEEVVVRVSPLPL